MTRWWWSVGMLQANCRSRRWDCFHSEKTNKFMNWMTWHSESLQLRHSNKKNTTTLLSEFSSSSDWRYEWKQGVQQKNRNKDYIRELKRLFSPHPTNTRPLERRIICVWFSSASYMWDVTLAKRKLCLFPVLPSPAVMVQRRPQQWSRRGMLLHSWSHSSLSLSPSIASALYLSPTVYLPVLLQQWLLCFALHPSTLLPIPPTISLTPLPSLPPVTAPQQSNAAPSASIALISRSHTSQVWRQDETEFGNFVVFMIKASCTCRFFPLAGFPANYKGTKAVSGIISAGWMSNHCEEQQNKLNDFSKFLHAVQNTSLGLVKHHGLAENTCFGRHTHGWKHCFLYVVTVKILVQNEVKLHIFLKTIFKSTCVSFQRTPLTICIWVQEALLPFHYFFFCIFSRFQGGVAHPPANTCT